MRNWESMIALSKGVDPVGYERMAQAAAQNSKHFRNAAASTGMFEVEQLKLNKATDDYVKALKARKLSFADMMRQQQGCSACIQRTTRHGADGCPSVPNRRRYTESKCLMLPIQRLSPRTWTPLASVWHGLTKQLKSGAHQMVNWGKNTQWAGRQLMVGFTLPVAAFGAAAGVMAYQVDKQMTRISQGLRHYRRLLLPRHRGQNGGRIRRPCRRREQATQTAIKAAKRYGSASTRHPRGPG